MIRRTHLHITTNFTPAEGFSLCYDWFPPGWAWLTPGHALRKLWSDARIKYDLYAWFPCHLQA